MDLFQGLPLSGCRSDGGEEYLDDGLDPNEVFYKSYANCLDLYRSFERVLPWDIWESLPSIAKKYCSPRARPWCPRAYLEIFPKRLENFAGVPGRSFQGHVLLVQCLEGSYDIVQDFGHSCRIALSMSPRTLTLHGSWGLMSRIVEVGDRLETDTGYALVEEYDGILYPELFDTMKGLGEASRLRDSTR